MPAESKRTFESVLRKPYWRAPDAALVLAALDSSDQSLAAFCKRHGLTQSRLCRWRKTLAVSEVSIVEPGSDFIELRVLEPAPVAGHPTMEVVVHGGRRIVLSPDFDTDAVVRLVEVLESVPC